MKRRTYIGILVGIFLLAASCSGGCAHSLWDPDQAYTAKPVTEEPAPIPELPPVPDGTHPMDGIEKPPLTLPGGLVLVACTDNYALETRSCLFVSESRKCMMLMKTPTNQPGEWNAKECHLPPLPPGSSDYGETL